MGSLTNTSLMPGRARIQCETFRSHCDESEKWPHLLVELGVEKRSITGAELTVPPAVKTGDESVVAAAGFLWSSFRRCSYNYFESSIISFLEKNCWLLLRFLPSIYISHIRLTLDLLNSNIR